METIKLLTGFIKELESSNLIDIKTSKDIEILANRFLTNQKL